MTQEEQLIQLFATDRLPNGVVGIGDDAALLPAVSFAGNILISTDVMIEDNHFSKEYFSATDTAFKLVEKSVSDIYVKGGVPRYCLLNMALKNQTATNAAYMKEFATEIAASAKRHNMTLVGGDTARTDGPDMFTMTVLGQVNKFIPRQSSKIAKGDLLVVQGIVGASQYALTRLQKKEHLPVHFKDYHVRPQAYAARASWLPKLAKVAIDQSDSLYEALLCLANNNKLALEVDVSLVPTLPEISRYPDFIIADYVLAGGEDFAVLAIIAEKDRDSLPEGTVVIGQVRNTNARPAIRLLYENKEFTIKTGVNYFLHFRPETKIVSGKQ